MVQFYNTSPVCILYLIRGDMEISAEILKGSPDPSKDFGI